MTEPKSTRADVSSDISDQLGPDEEAPAYDEPPAVPADPLFEDEEAPDLPPEPAPEPDQPENTRVEEPATASERAPAPDPEPQPAPEPVAEAAPVAEPAPLPAPEPDTVEEAAADAAEEAVDDPHPDIFGPEPWDQAPAPLPESRIGAWHDIGPAREEPPAKIAAEPFPSAAVAIGAAGAEATLEVKRAAFAVYLLYLSALVVVGIPLPIGAWLAYDARKDAPPWLRSHYTYQIRTFWICMGGLGLAGLVLFLPFALFPLTIVATVVWLVVRCFFGMVRLHRGEPIFNPQTWIV